MGTIKTLNKWANRHTYYPLDLVRIALGVFLFIKGIAFMKDHQHLTELFTPFQDLAGSIIMVHYVAPAHLIGGVLIAVGLLTRWSILAQIPILIGAVAINFVGEMNRENLIASSIAMLLALFFLIYGSGKHSADYYFKMQK